MSEESLTESEGGQRQAKRLPGLTCIFQPESKRGGSLFLSFSFAAHTSTLSNGIAGTRPNSPLLLALGPRNRNVFLVGRARRDSSATGPGASWGPSSSGMGWLTVTCHAPWRAWGGQRGLERARVSHLGSICPFCNLEDLRGACTYFSGHTKTSSAALASSPNEEKRHETSLSHTSVSGRMAWELAGRGPGGCGPVFLSGVEQIRHYWSTTWAFSSQDSQAISVHLALEHSGGTGVSAQR